MAAATGRVLVRRQVWNGVKLAAWIVAVIAYHATLGVLIGFAASARR